MWWRKDLLHIFVWANISTILDFDRFEWFIILIRFEWFIILIQMGMVPKEVLFISTTRMSWCLDKPRNILWKPLVFKTSVTLIMFCYIIADWTTTRHISVESKIPTVTSKVLGIQPYGWSLKGCAWRYCSQLLCNWTTDKGRNEVWSNAIY